MQAYLEEDLRIEMSALSSFNVDIIEKCIEFGKKKTELRLPLKILK
jgi:hypothetical protein